jgi:hypothetical protein
MEVTDKILYEKIKKKVYADIPKHSAYRSGILVQKYKEAFKNKYKNTRKKPYKGNRTKKKGLRRWFDEEWVNQRGEVGYKYKNDVYRPKIRITDDTPITHDELTEKEIEKARVKKYRKGRIDRFRKEKKSGGDRSVPPRNYGYGYNDDSDDEKYINDDERGFEFESDSDSDSDILNEGFIDDPRTEFNDFKRAYIKNVNDCFYAKSNSIMDVRHTDFVQHTAILEEQTDLTNILEDIRNNEEIEYCDGLSNFHYNANEDLFCSLHEEQLQELLNELSVEFHINPFDENEIRQIMLTSGLDYIDERMECIYLINQIIEEQVNQIIEERLSQLRDPESDISVINSDNDSDISFDGGKWSKKYKKSINCNKPKGFSQKQHCKHGKNKTQKIKIKFKDYPDFRPNLTPRDMFMLGSFGGTYWRPIKSGVTGKSYKNEHLKYPNSWWKDIPEEHLTSDKCDVSINKYKVSVGTSLEFWESKNWINKLHPYGWVQWYCDFYQGKRCPDDERQIQRWKNLAGPRGRFMRFLVTQIIKKGAKWNDETISPKIRQVLQHWGYKLTNADYNNEIKRRNA